MGYIVKNALTFNDTTKELFWSSRGIGGWEGREHAKVYKTQRGANNRANRLAHMTTGILTVERHDPNWDIPAFLRRQAD